jgi:SAM-dependent methyltransferase
MMLPDEYEQQERWRRWNTALARVPLARGQRVLDLGCGVGAVTATLAQAGVDVIGVDLDDTLLARARQRHPGLRFEKQDVGALVPSTFGRVDGIWASFVAAYFADVEAIVARWRRCVVDGGWLALVEIDDLLGHEPRASALAADIGGFYASVRERGGYGFECGRRLAPAMRAAGLTVIHEGTLDDDELAFDGPASSDVIDAWRARFARMQGMQAHFGARFADVERALLDSLASAAHRSLCRVVLAVARG